MDLDDIKKISLRDDDVIEVCYRDTSAPQGERIRLLYFERVIEELPEQHKQHNADPPYIDTCAERERHGCPADHIQISISDIKWLAKIGPSQWKELHYHS